MPGVAPLEAAAVTRLVFEDVTFMTLKRLLLPVCARFERLGLQTEQLCFNALKRGLLLCHGLLPVLQVRDLLLLDTQESGNDLRGIESTDQPVNGWGCHALSS